MKYIYYLTLLLLPFSLDAQNNSDLDSLRTVYKTHTSSKEKAYTARNIFYEFYYGQVYMDSAFYYTQRANEYAIEAKETALIAKTYYDQGCVWQVVEDFDAAIQAYDLCIEFSESNNLQNELAHTYHNKAIVLFQKGEESKAIAYFKKSQQIAQEQKLERLMANNNLKIGEIYLKEKEYQKAREYIYNAFEVYEKNEIIYSEVVYDLANLEFVSGNQALASDKALDALNRAHQENNLWTIFQSNELLSKIAASELDYKKAFEYQTNAQKMSDSLHNVRDTYSVEKFHLLTQLENQKNENLRHKEKNKFLVIIYILVFAGIFLIIVLISRQLKITKMTRDIHQVQERLIKDVLDKRENINNKV